MRGLCALLVVLKVQPIYDCTLHTARILHRIADWLETH